ncbi:SUPPRESSOR OF GAMMA RESPONSE 1-like isoform X2 [Phalaenopsis equestris]|uniref:SUPPRESSOR OF GAMMA RESPONSE 1-like isoform X2 n=1 Tax=Phalaenopsis equestris TaxID=78828 RepID=UPI0009E4C342|nr:SUPPRESSOR OF GAMMA RESPONSE 1-like isoform X2 [Phalaenopsis equestris]
MNSSQLLTGKKEFATHILRISLVRIAGVRKDGSSVHFFHRSLNAYSTGNRKRRRIQSGFCETEERVRWHKTGKTKPVLHNGVLKGWKKIMVLYRSSGKGSKPDKANWVLHQYHLGMEEEEKDGDLVVSKIFYQRTKQMDCNETETVREKSNFLTVRYSPRMPTTMNPQPTRSKMNPSYETDEHVSLLWEIQEEKAPKVELPPSTFPIVNLKNEKLESNLWAGESQAIEEPNPQLINESLLCSKVLKNFPPLEKSSRQLEKILYPSSGRADDDMDSIMPCVQQCGEIHVVDHSSNLSDVIFSQLNYSNTIPGCIDQLEIDADSARGFPSLENIEVDTPPDFQLSDLQFGSQDSITSWLDRL